MHKDPGERWHCVNAACRKEVVVDPKEVPTNGNPRCSCGTEMKRDYTPPVFRYLEFLHLDESVDESVLAERAPVKE